MSHGQPGLLISEIIPESIAEELEMIAGDRLLAINGHKLRDIVDYSYYSAAEEELVLEVEKIDGEIWELELEREPGESLGIIFESPKPSKCSNNCIFCFVHQLPKGLRKPLYVKDEDYRLSFLNGNYVTLANLKQHELQRIIEQRLSPLYISVHCTEPQLREKLLGVSGIPPILQQLQRLADAGIWMHTQIVLCPGLNDGDILAQTIKECATFHPAVQSIAIVPLGLTSHRKGLPALQPVTPEYAADFVKTWQPEAQKLRKKLGEPFLFLADEWFLKAKVPFPPIKEYGEFPQIENGVGMVPLFLRETKQILKGARPLGSFKVTVATGCSIFPLVNEFAENLEKATGVTINVKAIENRLFGASVTVSGLVSGNDIAAALAGEQLGKALLLPDVMVKEGESVFLDDVSLDELEKQLGVAVVLFDSTPKGFYLALKKLAKII